MNRRGFAFIFLASIISVVETLILVYHTENSVGLEEYDCIYYTYGSTVKYCVRPGSNVLLFRASHNCSNGEKWLFTNLLKQEISSYEVLSWSSSVEKADNYAHIFYNRLEEFEEESFLCKCAQGYFGKNCEYQLLFDNSLFSTATHTSFKNKKDPDGHQLWGRILCYETLVCDYGMVCLDWRNICDMIQNCVNGLDEENCDILEFNECEDNEFRCENGMCIAEEYWLDGKLDSYEVNFYTKFIEICQQDCMDRSDEMHERLGFSCPLMPSPFDCDDHICASPLWSCGDGRCLEIHNRHVYQTIIRRDPCHSRREYQYICETATDRSLWTKPDGLCANSGYNDTSLELTSDYGKCIYLIRCALSQGAEVKCPCNGSNCAAKLEEVCDPNTMYPYPPQGIVRPWILHLYKWERRWNNAVPDMNIISGGFRCRGFHLNMKWQDKTGFSYTNDLFLDPIFEPLLCLLMPAKFRNRRSQLQYSSTCWNDSLTFNGQIYAFHDICTTYGDCISQYRIGDWQHDCHDHEDEDPLVIATNNYCHKIQKHRFQCSTQQMTCVSPSLFVVVHADPKKSCTNNRHQFISGNGRPLETIKCLLNTDASECQLLRYYIGNSSIPNATFTYNQSETTDDSFQTFVTPFPYYCNTFWDGDARQTDEDPIACQSWICQHDQYQCRTGQCVKFDWVCDGVWDCSDASDEFHLEQDWSGHNQHLPDLKERKKICKMNQARLPFFDFCDFNHEYPCYRASVPDPLDIYTYRPCINFTHIGDGIEDCYGGQDELNTFKDCQGNMLGYTLRCGNECLLSIVPCFGRTCLTAVLCSYQTKNDSWCNGDTDVVCLDGTCAKNARCDEKYQCSHGEDEHWCFSKLSLSDRILYRQSKYLGRSETFAKYVFSSFPQQRFRYTPAEKSTSHLQQTDRQYDLALSFVCNRGFTLFIPATKTVRCACPPTHYGDYCEFFSDRLSVITHLDLTTFPSWLSSGLLTIIVTLHFEDTVVDHHIFHVNCSSETKQSAKQRFYLIYSRTNSSLEYKRWRFFKRTDILKHHPFAVHFDIFSFTDNQTNELGSFRYPIYFDFLPTIRLATVLKFPLWFSNSSIDPCAHNPCNTNSSCKLIFSQQPNFYCTCNSGYSGENCSIYEPQCSLYCSFDAVCRPKYRGSIGNPDHPLCICPPNRFGPRCYLENDACKSNPCGLHSKCQLTYDSSGENPIICVCSEQFYGERCQYDKLPFESKLI